MKSICKVILAAILLISLNSCGIMKPSKNPESDLLIYNDEAVKIVSEGKKYEPYRQYLISAAITDTGMLMGDGHPLELAEMFDSLTEISYADDFQVIIGVKDANSVKYSWHTDRNDFLMPYTDIGQNDLIIPSKKGVYIFCVDIGWDNGKTDPDYREYTYNRYIFKVKI